MNRQMQTMDGNTAAAHVSYAFTDVAAIYPITPSSNMAEETDKMAASGVKNLFGQTVRVVEMQSEAGAAGAVHGSLAAGALTTTYTASQGLLLMIPNMYKMAGELLPSVIHVSARAIAAHALSIFGDHSDVYSCRQTGYAMLCSTNPQEVMDLGAVAHLSAIKGSVPFLHFFDGFRTSHEVQKIEAWDYKDLDALLDKKALEQYRKKSLNPENPMQRGTAQNPDVFFQAKEAANVYYDNIIGITEEYMNKVNEKIGSKYKLFNYYGAKDATRVIIAMGSGCDTIEETVDHMNANGEKVGLIKVRLFRPFSVKHMFAAMPKTVKKITVLDRAKEPGSAGEPLYLDVVSALYASKYKNIPVYSGRYGLGSKDFTPAQVAAVYANMKGSGKKRFTVGIEDDLTNLSIPVKDFADTTPKGTTSCKFWGLGADGTVGANKNSIKIIGDNTNMYAQAYFSYDSKKSGGVTVSHLRFGKKPIKSTYLVSKADFVACHNPSYMDKYDIVEDIKENGIFLLNCSWDIDELENKLPGKVKSYISKNKIKFYTIDATHIAKELGLGGRVNTILQAAFFKLSKIIPADTAVTLMKDAAEKSYGKKGEAVVKMNHNAIDRGVMDVKQIDIPAQWADAEGDITTLVAKGKNKKLVDYINNVLTPVNAQRGNSLPVSTFKDCANGEVPLGTSAFEKRGIAVDVPQWISENCIQCNFCSYVCPHAVIRPFALDEAEAKKVPVSIPMTGVPELQFTLGISTLDCTGCGSCAHICPGRKGEKALVMEPIESQMPSQKVFDYLITIPDKPAVAEKFKNTTVKGSQFLQPLLEFSGACAGCGETPYAKLATQLFGERMYIANATGCSSIWGGSCPQNPYTANKEGKGPVWQNSLFEDNAEFGYGMHLAVSSRRNRLADILKIFAEADFNDTNSPPWVVELINASKQWIEGMNDADASKTAAGRLIPVLKTSVTECGSCGCEWDILYKEALAAEDVMVKKSFWIFGGDGWAYDIGFGGLDHVIASGEDVNILVFDTEVYSNTGGQSSKATPKGAIAQFAAAGKEIGKKDLGQIAMSYGYVYVASIAQGADYNQTLKAFHEAESYKGPSVIIAYSPCINHGIKGGMGSAMTEEKAAVAAGYWNLYRFDPRLKEAGKNPFVLDSKEPINSYRDFIMSEVRYSSLMRQNPKRAEALFAHAEATAKDKYDYLARLAKLYD